MAFAAVGQTGNAAEDGYASHLVLILENIQDRLHEILRRP